MVEDFEGPEDHLAEGDIRRVRRRQDLGSAVRCGGFYVETGMIAVRTRADQLEEVGTGFLTDAGSGLDRQGQLEMFLHQPKFVTHLIQTQEAPWRVEGQHNILVRGRGFSADFAISVVGSRCVAANLSFLNVLRYMI